MRVAIRKWGDSLALRIPKAVAEDADIASGAEVDVGVEDGVIIVRPVGRRRYSLHELLSAITTRNVHTETDAGQPVGREVW